LTSAGLCRNCNAAVAPDMAYCPKCGQAAAVPRLTLQEIGHDFMHAFMHVDRSALSLIRLLLTKPGIVAAEYIAGKRKRYFGPFGFLVITVALASAMIAISGFHVVFTLMNFQTVTPSPLNQVAYFLQRHINLIFFAEVPVLAAFCRLMGLRNAARFNYAEYLVLASYTSGLHMVFFGLVVCPVWYVLKSRPAVAADLYLAYLPIWPLYFGYAFSQFLPGPRLWSGIKGVIAVVLAITATVFLVSLLSDTYVKISQ
jgi:hypothetical protein